MKVVLDRARLAMCGAIIGHAVCNLTVGCDWQGEVIGALLALILVSQPGPDTA